MTNALEPQPGAHPNAGRSRRPVTDEMLEIILENRQRGLSWKLCAGMAGCSVSAINQIREKGARDYEVGIDDSREAEFYLAVEAAIPQTVRRCMDRMYEEATAAEGDWRAARDLVKMLAGGDYPSVMEHTGPDGGPIPVAGVLAQVDNLSPEEREQARALAIKRLTGDPEAPEEPHDGPKAVA